MSHIHSQFAQHLGKKILYKNKEYILEGVWMSYLHCVDKHTNKHALPINDCKIIIPNSEYLKKNPYNMGLCVYRDNKVGKSYVPATKSTKEVENDLIDKLCECSGITRDILFTVNKTRKRTQLYPRQIHMSVRRLLFGYSHAKSAEIYKLDHATTINSIKQVRNLSETSREWFDKFKPAFDVIVKEFGFKAVKRLSLEKHYPDVKKPASNVVAEE